MTNSHLTEIREMIDAGLRKHPKGLTAMLELVDDTDESGDMLDKTYEEAYEDGKRDGYEIGKGERES
jgi:flagellar biosynthesis/type III secretory pathway protein FliH